MTAGGTWHARPMPRRARFSAAGRWRRVPGGLVHSPPTPIGMGREGISLLAARPGVPGSVKVFDMPINWSDGILICDLADEPDLSEELGSVLAKLNDTKTEDMPNLVMDMSEVSYLNSSNIAQLLRVRKALVEAGRKMVMCAVADPVWSLMLLTNLDKVFHFASDKPTAIATLQLESGEN